MAEPWVYLKGEFVPASRASIAYYDAGIIMGATITDLTRTFRQRPFRLEEHVQRLYRSLKYARLSISETPDRMLELSQELIERNAALLDPSQELALVHFVTAGEWPLYAGAAGGGGVAKPTVCVHTFPLPFQLWAHAFTEGYHVVTPSTRHVPPECVDQKIKNRSRLHWWLADQETHLVDPKATSLLLDLQGNLTECSGANFLLVQNGAVLSPTTRNILPGITRQTVIELCAELAIPFIERDLQIYDAVNADEAFLSSTPFCLAPVSRINGLTIGDGQVPGPIARRLLDAWSERVGVNIVQQILDSQP